MNWRSDPRVAVARDAAAYPSIPPFHPSEVYVEWPGAPVGAEDNPAFRAVRQCLLSLGLDTARAGTVSWDPLGDIVRPGDTVVLKPNLVSHRNLAERSQGPGDTDGLVTHGSVVRAVADYVARALRGSGTIIIGDCPIQGTRWEQVVALTALDRVAAHVTAAFPGVVVRVEDFRLGRAAIVQGRVAARTVDVDRQQDYAEVDIGDASLLLPLMQGDYAFGVAQYPRHRMVRAHTPTRNLYLFPKAFIEADVFINLPKLKGHMKAGVTCALKNLVGINGHKDYLPHFRFGSPSEGGDEYPNGNWLWHLIWRLTHADWELDSGRRKASYWHATMVCYAVLRKVYGAPRGYLSLGGGSWWGNDTLWRTVLDINRAFLYCDRAEHTLQEQPAAPRRYLAIIDGLIGGHRESPLAPASYPSGFMIAGRNPVATDTVATALMGFDWRRVRQVARAYGLERFPLTTFGPDDVRVAGLPNIDTVEDIYRAGIYARFEPSFGYRGAVEYGPPRPEPDGSRPSARWSLTFVGSEEVGAGAP